MAHLVETGLVNAFVAGLLALLALLASRFVRRPALTHALWLLVLLKLVTPPLFHLPVPGWREQAPPPVAVKPPVDPSPVLARGEPFRPPPPPMRFTKIADIGKGLPPDLAPALPPVALPAPPPRRAVKAPEGDDGEPESPSPSFPWLIWASIVWLTGAALFYLLAAVRVHRFQRLLRHARPAPDSLVDEVRRVATSMGLRSIPTVWVVPGPLPPLLWAFGPARLLLPQMLMGRLEEPGRLALLVHELAHYARRDHWVRWFELTTVGLFWWYPVAWLARERLQASEEECCDAWVAAVLPGYGAAYAGAILDTVDFLSGHQLALPPAASGFGAMNQLKKRLAAIVQCPAPRSVSTLGWAVLLFAALLLPLVPGRGPAAPPPQKAEAPPTPQKKVDAQKEALARKAVHRDPPGYKPTSRVFNNATGGRVWAVALSPDEKTLAVTTGGSEGEGAVVLFDFATGKELACVVEATPVRCVAFSPDGKYLATGGFDNLVKLRDPRTGQTKRVLKGHSALVVGLAFSGDSRTLLTGGLDKLLLVWDTEKGTVIRPLAGHADQVLGVALSKDGKTALSASKDETARIWDVSTGNTRHVLKGHTSWVEGVALSPDGKTAATCGHDSDIRLWDAGTGTPLRTIQGHNGIVAAVRFTERGKALASVGHDRALRLWDVATGDTRKIRENLHAQRIDGLAVTSNGLAITGSWDRFVKVSSLDGEESPRVFQARRFRDENIFPILCLAVSPDGKRLAVGGAERVIKILDAATGSIVRILPGHEDAIGGLAYSPDGKTLASAGFDGTICLWDATTGIQKRKLTGHTNWVFCVAWSPDGALLASGGYDRTVRLWNPATGKELATLRRHKGGVRAVAFPPGGGRLASCGTDRSIRIWDLSKKEEALAIKGHDDAIRSLDFDPEGRLISCSEDGTIRLWDAAGKELKSHKQEQAQFLGAAFSPGGGLLAVGERNRILVLESKTLALRAVLSGHADLVTAITFSPDGRTLYTAGRDRIVRAWPAASERRLWQTSLVEEGPVRFNLFSPDGKYLASGGQGKVPLRVRPGLLGKVIPVEGTLPVVHGAARSPDGKAFALGLGDGSILLIDAASGKRLKKLAGHKDRVWAVAFSPDGKRLASVSGSFEKETEPGQAKLWDLTTGKVERVLGELTAPAQALAWSADGRWIALGQRDGQAFLVDAATGKETRAFKAGNGSVRGMAFSPDSLTLATGESGGTVKLWEVPTAREKQSFKGPASGVHCVSFSPDGATLAITSRPPDRPSLTVTSRPSNRATTGEVWLFKRKKEGTFTEGPMLRGHKQAVLCVAWSADGKEIASGGGVHGQSGEIVVWDAATGRPRLRLGGHREWVEALAFGKDGKTLLAAGGTARGGGEAMIHNIAPGGWTKANAHKGGVTCAAWSPDSRWLVTGGKEGSLRVWDGATGRLETEWEAVHKGTVRGIAFSPDGKHLATCAADKTAKVWDFAAKELITEWEDFPQPTLSVTWSPDGKRLAVACGAPTGQDRSGKVAVYDTDTWEERKGMEWAAHSSRSLAWSPDGKTLAVAGLESTALYHTATGKLSRTLKGASPVRCVAWTAAGKHVVTAHTTGVIQAWEAATGREVIELAGHARAVLGMAFGPDGRLASASSDGTAKTWEKLD